VKKTIRLAAGLLVAAAFWSCSIFDYSGMVVHKYALVYGVTRYTTDVAGPNLQFPDADASSMASLLASQGYTVKSRWVDGTGLVWNDGSSTSKTIGAPATNTIDGSVNTGTILAGDALAPSKTNIRADILGLAGTIGPNDILVVYFSGHGTQDSSTTPPREFFDPYGAVMKYTVDGKYYDFPFPSVRDDDLRAVFDTISTPRKVLILDTCNSGGFIGNQLESDWTSAAGSVTVVGPGTLAQAIANYASMQSSPTGLSPYGAQVLSAAGKDELSYESSSLGHGVLTYYLLQGLQGSLADLNKDGHVTVLEAFAYAKAGVDQNWNGNSGVIAAQETFEPHVSGGPVDFVLF
jgi:hypothetical protein